MSFTLCEIPRMEGPKSSWRYCRAAPHGLDSRSPLPRRRILVGDAAVRLRELPAASIDTCITSPPYFMLRNYQTDGQLGMEEHVDQWVANVREVVQELTRVLKPTGSLWLNLGDSYSRGERYGQPAKGLLAGPERLLLALMGDGWIVRNKVVWAKPNPMPHSVRDRFNSSHEFIYFLVRSRSYFFDLDRVRTPHQSKPRPTHVRPGKYNSGQRSWAGPLAGNNSGLARARIQGRAGHPLGKNPGDVWAIPTGGFRGPHFAPFPEALVRPPLLASCPERLCQMCDRPWRRVPPTVNSTQPHGQLVPRCNCRAGWVRGVVLDPFLGSGTVGVVAEQNARDWIGIELNSSYAALAEQRIRAARDKRDRKS